LTSIACPGPQTPPKQAVQVNRPYQKFRKEFSHGIRSDLGTASILLALFGMLPDSFRLRRSESAGK
jgi:hypothetical protein